MTTINTPTAPTAPERPRYYYGELTSGDFGEDTGRYWVYVESRGMMARHEKDGRDHWHSRAEAWQAAGQHSGHIVVLGAYNRHPKPLPLTRGSGAGQPEPAAPH